MLSNTQAPAAPVQGRSKSLQKALIALAVLVVAACVAAAVGVSVAARNSSASNAAVLDPLQSFDFSAPVTQSRSPSAPSSVGEEVNVTYANDLKAAKIFSTATASAGSEALQRYIVVYNSNATRAEVDDAANILFGASGNNLRAALTATIGSDRRSQIISKMASRVSVGRRVAVSDVVKYVEPDATIQLGQPHAQVARSWGTDRLNQRALPVDGNENHAGLDGSNVDVYIIDTGIRTTHSDFGGRATAVFDAINDGYNGEDCNGHGTHVAGTVGGGLYGVAKNTRLKAVRVLDCAGSGTVAGVVGGVDFVTANRNGPSVASMSLGGSPSQALDDAITRSIGAGVTFVVAAGNEAADACGVSPARTPSAITVGATDISDIRASFSNYGRCVDLSAPGVNILSAWNTGDGATNSISGTSMATPHVSGVAALYLQLFPTATAEQVTAAVLCASTKNIVRSPGVDSPNRLLYSLFDGCVNATLPPPNAAPTTTPRPATPPGCSCTCPAPATTEPALPPGDTTAPSGDTPAPTTTVAGGTPPPSTAAPSPTSAAATAPQTTPGPNSPVTFTGTLTREGQGLAFLANGGAMVSKGKVLEGRLIGPSGTDFDLYVESEENLDGVVYWMRAGSSAGLSSNEFLSYTHRRDYPRKYRWVAYSYRGTGPFTLTIQSLA